MPVHALLGGKLRDAVPFASYLFFRYRDAKPKRGEVRTPSSSSRTPARSRSKHGFRVHKLKGGVYPPAYELECYRALADAFPDDRFRYDPNSALSLADAIDFGRGIEDLRNDYFEDPVWGMPQLARLKEFVSIPTATNTVVVNFEQLAANIEMRAVDVVLLDTTFWGGIRPCIKAAGVCETMGIGVAVHSSGELGIQLATMLHLGAVLPNLGYAADAHYHHLTDDVIVGGRLRIATARSACPTATASASRSTATSSRSYHELYRELGGYPYDRDPGRPGWYPLVPNSDWADPTQSMTPRLAPPTRARSLAKNTRTEGKRIMSGRLQGKTALITAAGQGIGHATARRDGRAKARRSTRPTSIRSSWRSSRASPASRRACSTCSTTRRSPGSPTSCRRSTSCSTARATSTTGRSSTARRRTGTSASTSTSARCT